MGLLLRRLIEVQVTVVLPPGLRENRTGYEGCQAGSKLALSQF